MCHAFFLNSERSKQGAADISEHEDELEINAGGSVVVQDSVKLDNFGVSNELSAQVRQSCVDPSIMSAYNILYTSALTLLR